MKMSRNLCKRSSDGKTIQKTKTPESKLILYNRMGNHETAAAIKFCKTKLDSERCLGILSLTDGKDSFQDMKEFYKNLLNIQGEIDDVYTITLKSGKVVISLHILQILFFTPFTLAHFAITCDNTVSLHILFFFTLFTLCLSIFYFFSLCLLLLTLQLTIIHFLTLAKDWAI